MDDIAIPLFPGLLLPSVGADSECPVEEEVFFLLDIEIRTQLVVIKVVRTE